MKLWRLVIACLFFLTQITLAQKPGVVSDTVLCKGSPDQTYALYLPGSYSQDKPVGLILFFDPGARGRMPVDLYKTIADKYSVILACSNNSRNGSVDASLRAGNAVLEDVLGKYNVDKRFMLLSGFSGGARTAVDMATKNKIFAGIIACGAAFPTPEAIKMQNPIPFAEVIGQLDMNYQEALRASEYLKMIHCPASLTLFYGGHQWPPVDAYEDAVAWHMFRSKKDTGAIEKKLARAKVQIDSGYLFEASITLKPMLGTKRIDSLFSIVQKDRRTRPQAKEAEKVDALERQMQQQFYYAYTRHLAYAAPDSAYHPKYWTNFRRDCGKMIEGDRYMKFAGLRLIDYGWRMPAEQHFFFMNEEQYRQAAMSARIWALMMPANPNSCIQAAKAFALQKRKPEMLDYLRQALARGFKDKKALLTDPDFSEYSKDKAFLTLLN